MNKRQFLQTCASVSLSAWTITGHSGLKKNIRILVPFAPQGVSTLLAEEICAGISERGFGSCTVDHAPGMTNMVATRMLLKQSAKENSVTLMIAGPSIFTVGQHLNPFMSINPVTDLTILTSLAKGPMMLVTNGKSSINTWEKLAALKTKKTCAVSGLGSSSHVVAAYIDSSLFSLGSARSTDGDLPGIQHVLNGDVTCAVVSMGSCKNHLDGSLHFLLNSGDAPLRLQQKKVVPTIRSVARIKHAPDFVFENWLAVIGPKNLNPDLLAHLEQALQDVAGSEKMYTLVESLLHSPMNISPKEMMERVENNAQKWSDYVNRLQLHQALELNL